MIRDNDAENYKEAAKERIADAFALYQHERYVLSLYSSGVAVECILRAFRVRVDREFDSRHDLFDLYRMSKLGAKLDSGGQGETLSALSALSRLWRNDHRYETESGLLRMMKRGRHDRGIRGSVSKEIARRAYNAGQRIVSMGVAAWTD